MGGVRTAVLQCLQAIIMFEDRRFVVWVWAREGNLGEGTDATPRLADRQRGNLVCATPPAWTAASLRGLLHDGLAGLVLEATTKRVFPCGVRPGREGKRRRRCRKGAQLESVGSWVLAIGHSRQDASFPPPHSGSSEFDGFPAPQLTTAALSRTSTS